MLAQDDIGLVDGVRVGAGMLGAVVTPGGQDGTVRLDGKGFSMCVPSVETTT